MPQHSAAVATAIKGTAIALVTWLVLYLTKESLGRTAALIVAAILFLFFAFVVWARMRVRAGTMPPNSDRQER